MHLETSGGDSTQKAGGRGWNLIGAKAASNQSWRVLPVISALGKWRRQENQESESALQGLISRFLLNIFVYLFIYSFTYLLIYLFVRTHTHSLAHTHAHVREPTCGDQRTDFGVVFFYRV